MKSIVKWLQAPYYFNPSIIFKLRTSFTLGWFIFLFLYIFHPFSLAIMGDYLLEYTATIGFFSFIGSFSFLYVPPLIFTKFFDEDKWTVGKNVIFIFIAMLFIGFLLWYYTGLYKSDKNIEKIGLVKFILYTFLVGAMPIFFLIFRNERALRKKRIGRIREIKAFNEKKKIERDKILQRELDIYSDNKKEKISFNINNLVYITSEGNYASFFIRENNTIKEKILRITLSKIEKELEDFTKIIRCHKSYIVNTKYINDINGNARGYILKSNIISLDIPVSRSFSKQSLMSLIN